jgi:hypothetical protein
MGKIQSFLMLKVDGAYGTPGTHSYHCDLKFLLAVLTVSFNTPNKLMYVIRNFLTP